MDSPRKKERPMKTVVGLYDTKAKANQVKDALTGDGFESSKVSVMDQNKESYAGNYDGGQVHESVGERIKQFFGVFGEGEHSGHETYTSGVERGGAIVAVKADDEEASDAAALLHRYGAQEVDDRYSSGTGTRDAYATKSSGNEQVIPIVQEELEVGKRQVNRGGVRVYTHMVETPVSENISLHDERIVVERHPVNRAATDADFNTGSGVVELTAMGEEAVVGKRSRVVEEVSIGKVGSDRTEQINDTVRHTEVDVEKLTGDKNRN